MDKDNAFLESWSFDVFSYELLELDQVVCTMFSNLGLLNTFAISAKKFHCYLQSIRDNYQDNAYHNYRHAVEVTQFIYLLDAKGYLKNHLSIEKRFGLLIAALNHDIAHPGKSACYHKLLATDLEKKYGPISTLERYHIQVAKALWNDPQHLLFPKKKAEVLEKYVEQLILATDMQRHKEFFLFCQEKTVPIELRKAILLIKCADLNHLIRDKSIKENWRFRLNKELYLENLDLSSHKEHIPVNNPCNQHRLCQKEFIDKVAFPLYNLLEKFFPKLENITEKLL